MSGGLLFGVTFDPSRGYVETAPELRSPVTALSRGGLSRKMRRLPDAAGSGRRRTVISSLH